MRELVQASLYAVDEPAVAHAIVARAGTRYWVAEQSFRSELPVRPVRSFRRDAAARSFRLAAPARMRHH